MRIVNHLKATTKLGGTVELDNAEVDVTVRALFFFLEHEEQEAMLDRLQQTVDNRKDNDDGG